MKRKRLFTVFAGVLTILLLLSALAACGKKHTFSEEWKADESNHWHECTAKKHTDTSEKEDHAFDDGEITTQPTETEKGVKTFTCKICGYRKTEAVDTLPHTHKFNTEVWEKDQTNHWRAASCEHTTEKDALAAHTFSKWTEKTPAAVHSDRVEQRSCTVCGYEETKTIAGTALHSYNESQWMKDETGHWHESTCAGHDPKLTKDFAAHSGAWTVKTEADYGQNRIEQRDCAVCGYHEERTVEGSMLPPKARTITIDDSFDGFVFDGTRKSIEKYITVTNKEGGMKIEYRLAGTENWSVEVPIEAGTYEYSVVLTGTPEWAEYSFKSSFRIAPYGIKLTASKFEIELGGSLSGGSFGLMCEDVTSQVNSWTDWVTVCVPEAYRVAGRHTIPVGELFTDEENFTVDAGSLETVEFLVLDTADFYCGIQDIFTMESGATVIIQTVIARGTLYPGDEIYIQELGKTITVTAIEANRKILDKATVGDKVVMKITGATKEELKRGFMLAKPDSMEAYDRFVVTIRFRTKEEGGRHTPALSGYPLTLRFTDTGKEVVCRITLPNGMEMLAPGETLEGVALDFGIQEVGFIGRNFIVIESGKTIAEGTVTDVHSHTKTSVLSSGHCLCGYDVSDDLDGTGDSCTSGRKHYLKTEQRIFDIAVSPSSGSGTVRYKIALSAAGFTFRVYDGGSVLTPDADGVVALRADATKLQVIVVASDNGYCEMTVTKNPPVRLIFDEATGKAISEKRFYTKGSASEYIIGLGAPSGNAVRYTFSLSNSANFILAVYDSAGNNIIPDPTQGIVLPQGTAISDYRMVVTCTSVGGGHGAIAVQCQLTVTATTVA